MPSSSRPARESGSPASTRPGMSRSRPSTTPYTLSAARSTPAHRATRRPCSFRSSSQWPGTAARDRLRRLPRPRRGEPEERPGHQGAGGRTALSWPDRLVRVDPAATARSSLGPAAYSEYEQVFGSRLVARWPHHMVLDGLETLDLLLDSGNLMIHPRCTRLKEAFQTYRRQRRGGEWIDFPADGHPEEDLIDALRGGVRDAFPESLLPKRDYGSVHASRIMG